MRSNNDISIQGNWTQLASGYISVDDDEWKRHGSVVGTPPPGNFIPPAIVRAKRSARGKRVEKDGTPVARSRPGIEGRWDRFRERLCLICCGAERGDEGGDMRVVVRDLGNLEDEKGVGL